MNQFRWRLDGICLFYAKKVWENLQIKYKLLAELRQLKPISIQGYRECIWKALADYFSPSGIIRRVLPRNLVAIQPTSGGSAVAIHDRLTKAVKAL